MTLTEEELQFVANRSFFDLKKQVTEKIISDFNLLRISISQQLMTWNIPESLKESNPRISKGENYEGYPWIVLDYPSIFSKADIFAIRTIFLWGRHISINIQLSGKYLEQVQWNKLKDVESDIIFISVHENPWVHHQSTDNYKLLKNFISEIDNPENHFKSLGYMKFSAFVPLEQFANTTSITELFLKKMKELISFK